MDPPLVEMSRVSSRLDIPALLTRPSIQTVTPRNRSFV